MSFHLGLGPFLLLDLLTTVFLTPSFSFSFLVPFTSLVFTLVVVVGSAEAALTLTQSLILEDGLKLDRDIKFKPLIL